MPGRLAALLHPQPTLRRRGRSLVWPALALTLLTSTGRAATAPGPAPPSATPTKPAPPATSTSTSTKPGPPATDRATPTPPQPEAATSGDAEPEAPATSATGPRVDVPRPAPAPHGEIAPRPPRDPNDAPFMQPPNNQPRPTRLRTSPDVRRGYSSVRRFAATIAPVFASFRLPFLGRTSGDTAPRQHGVGVGGELDVQIIRWLWARAQASYSAHPVGDVRVTDDKMNVEVVAPSGLIQAVGFGVGPVVALDLGRFVPLIEGGIGGLRVATPPGVKPGQMGQACINDAVCDVGLRCGGGNTCQQGLIADLYFGGAVDMLVRRHISLGVQFRYHALLTAPGKFPVYLIGGLRLGIRF